MSEQTVSSTAIVPGALITVKDLYDELRGMRDDFTKLMLHLEQIDVRTLTADRERSDHEIRIRGLERFKYTLLGSASLAGIASGVITSLISARIIRLARGPASMV